MTIHLNALNSTADLKRARSTMAILPVGATEGHGAHLALATDTLIAETIAQRVAQRLGAYCLPALPFSVSHMHRGSHGSIWLRNATLTAVVRDIAASLRHDGFHKLVVLNAHGGNFILVPIVQDLNLDFPDLLTLTFDVSSGIERSGIFEGFGLLRHGDEFETSCVLHICADAVQRDKIRDQTIEPDRELLRYLPFGKFSKLTHSGQPSRATAELGRRALEFMTDDVIKNVQATLAKVAPYRKPA